MCTLGELFKTVGRDVVPYQDKLLPLIIDTLHDQSSVSKRTVALNTLGQLAGQTGNVVKPYMQYPKLLHLLLTMLHGGAGGDGSNVPWALRREVIKTFGILGAIDPHKHMVALQRTMHRQGAGKDIGSSMAATTVNDDSVATGHASKPSAADANAAMGADNKHEQEEFGQPQQHRGAAVTEAQPRQDEAALPTVTPASEEYYSTVAISRLMQVMRETTLGAHHHMAVQAVMFIIKSLGLKCVPFLQQIVPPLLQVAKKCESGLREFVFQQIRVLVSVVRQHMRPYLPQIFSMLAAHWAENLEQILSLVMELSVVLKDEFKAYMPQLIPLLLKPLELTNRVYGRDTQQQKLQQQMQSKQMQQQQMQRQRQRQRQRQPVQNDTIDVPMPEQRGGEQLLPVVAQPHASELVLRTLVVLGPSLDCYLYLIIPQLVKLLACPSVSLYVFLDFRGNSFILF